MRKILYTNMRGKLVGEERIMKCAQKIIDEFSKEEFTCKEGKETLKVVESILEEISTVKSVKEIWEE